MVLECLDASPVASPLSSNLLNGPFCFQFCLDLAQRCFLQVSLHVQSVGTLLFIKVSDIFVVDLRFVGLLFHVATVPEPARNPNASQLNPCCCLTSFAFSLPCVRILVSRKICTRQRNLFDSKTPRNEGRAHVPEHLKNQQRTASLEGCLRRTHQVGWGNVCRVVFCSFHIFFRGRVLPLVCAPQRRLT